MVYNAEKALCIARAHTAMCLGAVGAVWRDCEATGCGCQWSVTEQKGQDYKVRQVGCTYGPESLSPATSRGKEVKIPS